MIKSVANGTLVIVSNFLKVSLVHSEDQNFNLSNQFYFSLIQ